MLHKNITVGDIHYIQQWEPADSTARLALTVATTDVGKIARQLDTNVFYLLMDDSPMTWADISTSGSGDVVGPASATDNAIVRFDGTTGKLVQNSAATIADTTGDITAGAYNTVVISGASTPTLAVTGTTTVSGANTGDQSLFSTIAVSGQSNVVADTTTDTLTLVAGTNLAITTDAGTDTVTFTPSLTPVLNGITLNAAGTIVFEGTTADDFETTLSAGEPTADRTVTLPNATTTLAGLSVAQTFSANQTFTEVTDTVYTISDGAAFEIDPGNGSIQVVTLGANRTPAATNFAAGQIVLLGIDDGTAFTITWTTVAPTWVKPGGTASAPTLATTGYTWVLLWKVGSTIYGAEAGKP